jgi:hypothetical protein
VKIGIFLTAVVVWGFADSNNESYFDNPLLAAFSAGSVY